MPKSGRIRPAFESAFPFGRSPGLVFLAHGNLCEADHLHDLSGAEAKGSLQATHGGFWSARVVFCLCLNCLK